MYKAQYYDTDSESWEDFDEVEPSSIRDEVVDAAKYEASKCAYKIKWRVIED
jgi:hypothetical protein